MKLASLWSLSLSLRHKIILNHFWRIGKKWVTCGWHPFQGFATHCNISIIAWDRVCAFDFQSLIKMFDTLNLSIHHVNSKMNPSATKFWHAKYVYDTHIFCSKCWFVRLKCIYAVQYSDVQVCTYISVCVSLGSLNWIYKQNDRILDWVDHVIIKINKIK